MRLFRPDVEHFLCLILFCLLSILGFVFWTYEDGQAILGRGSDGRHLQSDIYDAAIDGFLRDERRLMEERAAMFPEFPAPEEDSPDVVKRHKDSVSVKQEMAMEKSDRVLNQINLDFKSQRKKKKKRRKMNQKGRNSTKDELVPLKGGEAFCKVYDTKPDIDEDFECIRIAFKPSVQICLYPDAMDVHVSYHLRDAGIWEPHMLRHFQNILYQDPQLGVYDIGANIGQYSLVAAAMGRKVVAVEPHVPSLRRLHKAIKLGKLEDKIILIQNAISDRRETLELSIPGDNQGGVGLTSQDADRFCTEPDCPPQATTIVMDDLLEVTNFDKAIIKVDIEGHEHRAFIKSQRLFENVDVQYIFMEWIKLREYYGSEADDTRDKRLVFDLIDYLVEMGYTARGSLLLNKLDPLYWYGWPDDIYWEASDDRRKGVVTQRKFTSNVANSNSTVGIARINSNVGISPGNSTGNNVPGKSKADFPRGDSEVGIPSGNSTGYNAPENYDAISNLVNSTAKRRNS